ncbi:hypothetical protein LPJ66_001505 [Kickxella alabastrina]|uniref:Uncharacterized protein n=1 Tax=Kickxella alabastrina TaxID=61397 RepID=A0ACC1IT37_9FUNG|nr:hypothetical protein LPJ66_001505 [Kickxella alabastrina]
MPSSRSFIATAIGILTTTTLGYHLLMRGQKKPKHCVFCNPLDRIVYEDDKFIAFHDIRPDATAHLLVIPRQHYGTIKELTPEDMPMVERMYAIGQRVLEEHGFSSPDETRFGFHRPPFNSVHHLHMHCLGLPFKPKRAEMMFPGAGSPWFMPTEHLLRKMLDESVP